MFLLLSLIYCICFLNINANDINNTLYLSSVNYYRNRFFVCLPELIPTLYEIQYFSIYFPTTKLKPFANQNNLITCKRMDIDSRGRLWILDVPKSNEVIPKILVYNTLTYTELLSCDLKNVLKNNLNTIIIDPVVNAFTGSRAYIGYSNENEILVYSLKEHRYWRLKFENENSPLNICASYFAVSKREPILYLSGKSDERLFSINLNILRKLNGPPAIVGDIEPAFINVTYLGNKLGPSSGLISDFKGNIYYYLIRDYAVVRWNAKKSLQAENHKILMQSAEKLPFVTQFFAGPQYSIWAVINNNTFTNATTTNEFNLFEKIIKIGTGF